MSRTEIKYLFLILVTFIAACIETDIYLPAFPDMMAYFKTTEEAIQSLLTWNFFGICVSGPLYGPISDAIGRKKPLIFALVLFLLGSLLTLFAESYELMLWGRLLQGLGSGGCFTLGTAIIFDVFQKEKAVKAMNQLNSIVPFIMAFAPMLGGYLNYSFGFRSNFLAIAIFVAISFMICMLSFDETLKQEKRAPFQLKKVANDFKTAFSCLGFWQLTFVVSLLFAGYLVFLSITSVLFVIELGVSKGVIPFFQATLLGAWLIANLTSSTIIKRLGLLKVKMIGAILVGIGGLGVLTSALFAPQNPYIPTGFMTIYSFGVNWTLGLYFTEAMEILPDIKGVTASLISSARLLITAVIVGLAGAIYNATIYPVAAIIVGICAIVLPLIIFYEKRKALQSASEPKAQEPVLIH